jgi:hypothetical protein
VVEPSIISSREQMQQRATDGRLYSIISSAVDERAGQSVKAKRLDGLEVDSRLEPCRSRGHDALEADAG